MNALLPIVILFLGLSSPVVAQQQAPKLPIAKIAWQQHLADNELKIKNGDTGRLTITMKPRLGHELPPNLRARVTEHVPQHARPGPGIHITHHFVRMGNVADGTFTVAGIPIGLSLEIEVWPADKSAPPASYKVAGPKKRGQRASLEATPAQPFPLLAGRLLDALGDPICNQDVAIELRTKTLPYQMQARTDGEGRFRSPVRVTPHYPPHSITKSPAATITVVRGKLIRKGSYRFWTTEMPAGLRATAEIYWPWAVLTDIGDLHITPQ